MTPCEKLGYKVGDEFEITNPRKSRIERKGAIVKLASDDGSGSPFFQKKGEPDWWCHKLNEVTPITTNQEQPMTNPIKRTNGEPFATKANAKGARTRMRLTDTHDVIQHGGGWVLSEKQSDQEQGGARVTLRPGDYIATEGLSEDDYHAVAAAFHAAGAMQYGDSDKRIDYSFVGWHNGKFQGLGGQLEPRCGDRQLTLSQILSATNAGGEDEKEMTAEQWVPEVGEVCLINDDYHLCGCQPLKLKRNDRVLVVDHVDVGYGPICLIMDEAKKGSGTITFNCLRPIPTEEDRAVDEMVSHVQASDNFHSFSKRLYQQGYRKQPQPADDMSDSANWLAGDVLECVKQSIDLTVGKCYTVKEMDYVHDPIIDDDKDKNQTRIAQLFRFIRRP